jgi:8-oxo-dGTP pyrophosphatase MutT (NUDIX family)
MGFLDAVKACNRHDLSGYLPFVVDGVTVGRVRPGFAQVLAQWDKVFSFSSGRLGLLTLGKNLQQRSEPLADVLKELVEQGVLSHLHGEQYVATPGGRNQGMILIDRAAASYFGIRTFGQHINGFVRVDDGVRMWVGRRSDDRRHFPGRLDHLAAGGLPHGIGLQENLVKECWEEAGIVPDLALNAVPVGAVTYVAGTKNGLKPDTLYCYDLELPPKFQPRCMDGEVQEFNLWPLDRVMEGIREPGLFKPNCNLVILDFLIRHGYLGPDDENYLELVASLHPPLP